MRGIDSHCHLDFEQFDEDRDEVIERSRRELEMVVNPGANPSHNEKAFKLHKEFPDFVKFNVGLHPVYTDSFDELEKVMEQIKRFEPCAVGEIGLDYHHVSDETVRERQREVFREMLGLAEELSLPVVLHTRDAEDEVLDILEDYKLEGVFLHCFNGSVEQCKLAQERGYKIGVTTQVLYSSHVQELVKVLELDNILLETDSPYLYRGSRNEPLNIIESAEKIAEIKQADKSHVLDITQNNSVRFFDL